jgi:hypothetical protein
MRFLPFDNTPTSDTAGRAVWLAVAAQLFCAAYLQFIEWVPLSPWNNIANGNQQEVLDIVLAVLQVAFALAFVYRVRWAMALGLTSYVAWFALQIDSWWRPYLFGGRTVGPNWWFAHTYKFLPQIGNRPTPDAAHVVLQITLLLVIITGIAAWRAARRTTTAPSPASEPIRIG